MSNYSYSEIQNMQKKAMERVREMQKNSEAVLQNAREDLSEKPFEYKVEKSRTEAPIKPKITNLPPNFPEEKVFPDFREYFNEQNENATEPPQKAEKEPPKNTQNNIFDSVLAEPDMALLLGLLLLLKSEGADEPLMMALMYIMA